MSTNMKQMIIQLQSLVLPLIQPRQLSNQSKYKKRKEKKSLIKIFIDLERIKKIKRN